MSYRQCRGASIELAAWRIQHSASPVSSVQERRDILPPTSLPSLHKALRHRGQDLGTSVSTSFAALSRWG